MASSKKSTIEDERIEQQQWVVRRKPLFFKGKKSSNNNPVPRYTTQQQHQQQSSQIWLKSELEMGKKNRDCLRGFTRSSRSRFKIIEKSFSDSREKNTFLLWFDSIRWERNHQHLLLWIFWMKPLFYKGKGGLSFWWSMWFWLYGCCGFIFVNWGFNLWLLEFHFSHI